MDVPTLSPTGRRKAPTCPSVHLAVRDVQGPVPGSAGLDLGEPAVDLIGDCIVDRRLDDGEPGECRGGHEADDRSETGEHGAGNRGRLHERHRSRDRRETLTARLDLEVERPGRTTETTAGGAAP